MFLAVISSFRVGCLKAVAAVNCTNRQLLAVNAFQAARNGYKSSISLDKLYPKSQQDHLTPPRIPQVDGQERFTGFIPIDKLEIKQTLSSKPGGQHVNKTHSSVEVRFNVHTSEWIPKWIREKLATKHANRLTKDGFIIVRSEKTRKAMLNQADCLDQIRGMIAEASVVPRGLDEEEKAKIETDKRIADGRRLLTKRKKSELKKYRKSASVYDSVSDNYIYR